VIQRVQVATDPVLAQRPSRRRPAPSLQRLAHRIPQARAQRQQVRVVLNCLALQVYHQPVRRWLLSRDPPQCRAERVNKVRRNQDKVDRHKDNFLPALPGQEPQWGKV
jgi:hypothetical protein